MRLLLRVVLLVNFSIAVILGHNFAHSLEDVFPSKPVARLHIESDGPGAETLADVVNREGLAAARVTYGASNGQTHREINVVASESDSSPVLPPLSEPYIGASFRISTEVKHVNGATVSATGPWLLYGAGEAIESAVAELSARGFTVQLVERVTFNRIIKSYFHSPQWVLQLAILALLFVVVLVYSQILVRERSIQAVHGRSHTFIWVRETLRYAAAVSVVVTIAASGWLISQWIHWGALSMTVFPVRIFLSYLLTIGFISVLVCAISVGINMVLVPGILAQLKGRQPVGLTLLSAALSLVLMLLALFYSFGYAQSAMKQYGSSRQEVEESARLPDGYSLALWHTSEQAVQEFLPAFRKFIDAQAQQSKAVLMLSSSRCYFLSSARPCLVVNEPGARELELPVAHDSRAQILLGERDLKQENVAAELAAALSAEAEFDQHRNIKDTQVDGKFEAADIAVKDLPRDSQQDINEFLGVEDHVGIVVYLPSARMISADNWFSFASQGNVHFVYDSPDYLLEELQKYRADELVSWMESPKDYALSNKLQAQIQAIQNLFLSVIALSAAAGLCVVMARAYRQYFRQKLFVQRIHGASALQKYGLFWSVLLVSSGFALAVNHGYDILALLIRLSAVFVIGLAGSISLISGNQLSNQGHHAKI